MHGHGEDQADDEEREPEHEPEHGQHAPHETVHLGAEGAEQLGALDGRHLRHLPGDRGRHLGTVRPGASFTMTAEMLSGGTSSGCSAWVTESRATSRAVAKVEKDRLVQAGAGGLEVGLTSSVEP